MDLINSLLESDSIRDTLLETAKIPVAAFMQELSTFSDAIILNKKEKQVYTIVHKRDSIAFKNFVKKAKWKIADSDETEINHLYWLE